MTVSFNEYQKDLKDFCKKHTIIRVETSSLTNDIYRKYYISDKGCFYEVNSIVEVDAKAVAYEIEVPTKVKLFRTEYWSTDNSVSKYCYERV